MGRPRLRPYARCDGHDDDDDDEYGDGNYDCDGDSDGNGHAAHRAMRPMRLKCLCSTTTMMLAIIRKDIGQAANKAIHGMRCLCPALPAHTGNNRGVGREAKG